MALLEGCAALRSWSIPGVSLGTTVPQVTRIRRGVAGRPALPGVEGRFPFTWPQVTAPPLPPPPDAPRLLRLSFLVLTIPLPLLLLFLLFLLFLLLFLLLIPFFSFFISFSFSFSFSFSSSTDDAGPEG